jgi:hypothetical protein
MLRLVLRCLATLKSKPCHSPWPFVGGFVCRHVSQSCMQAAWNICKAETALAAGCEHVLACSLHQHSVTLTHHISHATFLPAVYSQLSSTITEVFFPPSNEAAQQLSYWAVRLHTAKLYCTAVPACTLCSFSSYRCQLMAALK